MKFLNGLKNFGGIHPDPVVSVFRFQERHILTSKTGNQKVNLEILFGIAKRDSVYSTDFYRFFSQKGKDPDP